MGKPEKNSLFTSLTLAESANICGGGFVVVLKRGVNKFLLKTEQELTDEAIRLGLDPKILQEIKK